MESINRMAIELADEALDFAGELDIGAFDVENGATVLDFGVEHAGGLEAGLLLVELQTAGLATVQTRLDEVGGASFPFVELSCDRPGLALLCSQKAGWEISLPEFEGLGSGPARALVADEEEFRALGYTDAFDLTVLTVESDTLPDEAVAEHVADLAEVNTEGVYLPAYATGSIAGSVSMASRPSEMAVFRLFELGYDPADVLSVSGSAPVAPVAGDEEGAIARTTDAVVYGGRAHLTVREDSDVFSDLPSTAGDEYGQPSRETFDGVDWVFEDVAEGYFAPAAVTVNVVGGPTYALGDVDENVLAESFDL